MNTEQRLRFEAWLLKEHLLTATWDAQRNCYTEFAAHLAFKAWIAALEDQQPVIDDGLKKHRLHELEKKKDDEWVVHKPEGAPYAGIRTRDGRTIAGTSSGLSETHAQEICAARIDRGYLQVLLSKIVKLQRELEDRQGDAVATLRISWQREGAGHYEYSLDLDCLEKDDQSAFDVLCTRLGVGEHKLFSSTQPTRTSFQSRVALWMHKCFGPVISADTVERNHRFLEEALELVQACGCTQSEAQQLVDYVYGRPVGEKHQEVGGVQVTLAALCIAQGLDMHLDGETELERINDPVTVEKIRAKQAAKPKHSALPQAIEPTKWSQLYIWLHKELNSSGELMSMSEDIHFRATIKEVIKRMEAVDKSLVLRKECL